MITRLSRRETLGGLLSLAAARALPRFAISAEPASTDNGPDQQTEMAKLAAGNNLFALDLYRRLIAAERGNLIVSPYSVSSALAMTYAGARGDTETEMARVLHFVLPQAQLHPTFGALTKQLTAIEKPAEDGPPAPTLRIANRLWGQQGEKFLDPFLAITRNDYGAELGQLDFKLPAARETINAWVAEQTNEKIQNLIAHPIDPKTKLVLTNALFMNAAWRMQFDERKTQTEPFTSANSRQIQVKMMRHSGFYSYAKIKEAQLVELPYVGFNLSMLVLLPSRELSTLEKQLTADSLAQWTAGMEQQEVIVSFPRFAFETSLSMKDNLWAMGLVHALSSKPGTADFSGMNGRDDLYISDVIHKARVEVNERGTEAAAATAVEMVATSAAPSQRRRAVFRADRPFMFIIRDNATGSMLFVGRVVKPLAA